MKLYRMYGIVLRNLYFFKHSFERWTDAFYWPTIDLLIWGLTSTYFTKYLPNSSSFILAILSGIIFWMITYRSQYETSIALLDDVWSKNLINIFVSPLKFWEWIGSLVTIGVIKAFFSFTFALFIALLLYKVQVFSYGFYFIPFGLSLLLSGIWVSFLIIGFILRYGTRIQAFAWTMLAIISPFSAIYYPVSILPQWAQTISHFIPTSYVFEGLREVINKGTVDGQKLILSFILNIIYLILATLFLRSSFKSILKKGLTSTF